MCSSFSTFWLLCHHSWFQLSAITCATAYVHQHKYWGFCGVPSVDQSQPLTHFSESMVNGESLYWSDFSWDIFFICSFNFKGFKSLTGRTSKLFNLNLFKLLNSLIYFGIIRVEYLPFCKAYKIYIYRPNSIKLGTYHLQA